MLLRLVYYQKTFSGLRVLCLTTVCPCLPGSREWGRCDVQVSHYQLHGLLTQVIRHQVSAEPALSQAYHRAERVVSLLDATGKPTTIFNDNSLHKEIREAIHIYIFI